MKKTAQLFRWLAGGALAAGALQAGAAGVIFRDVFARRKPGGGLLPGVPGNGGEPSHFDPYTALTQEGRAWLKQQEPASEHWLLRSRDGLLLHARFLPADTESRRLVIGVHGYHSSGEEEYVSIARMFHEAGFHVLLIDQRAHGDSQGKIISFGCLERLDLQGWIDRAEHYFDGQIDIFLHGVSMGAATVLMTAGLALPPSVKGIAADCGYTTPRAILQSVAEHKGIPLAGGIVGMLDALCRLRAGFGLEDASAPDAAAKAPCPVFIIHGDSDTFVPVEMAYEIYDACREPKKLWIVKGAHHAESSCLDPGEYKKQVVGFFNSCL